MSAGAPVVVPVNLGCCPSEPRCLLCPPAPEPVAAEVVEALVYHYRTHRAAESDAVRVGFYGGPPPAAELLDAIDGLPFVARVRPDLLSRAAAAELKARGAVGIELDALTFHDAALRASGRSYRRRLVLEQLEGLRAAGLRVGVVLAPGLPGTCHADAVEDAIIAAPLVDFARLHPVLVLEGARLREAHMDARYRPLTVGEAVTTCRAMLDVLEPAGVQIVRVGQNPGPDGLGRAVAGPRHPALRQLVEGRRVLADLHSRLEGTPRGALVEIRCHPADETCTRGPRNQHVRDLRATHGLARVVVRADPTLDRGEIRVATLEAT